MFIDCYFYSAQNISDMLEKQHGIVVGVARINLPAPLKVHFRAFCRRLLCFNYRCKC